MTDRDLERRKEKLLARRTRLSNTQQALLEQRLKGTGATAPSEHAAGYLVPLQTGQAACRPLFLVHPVDGRASCYIDLARYLDPDQPCYGIQAAGDTMPTSIEALAAGYIQLIRDTQVEGPYLLGGWSFGGVVAFEMAQQLRAQQHTVALLTIIDSQFMASPARAQVDDEVVDMIGFALALGLPLKFGDSAQLTLDQQYAQALGYLRTLKPEERLAYVLAQAQQARLATASYSPEQLRLAFHIYQANVRAMKQYRPHPYHGRIFWFEAGDRLGSPATNHPLAWKEIAAGELNVHTVAGHHYSILREPQVQVVAAQLQAQLAQIRSHR